MLFDAHSDIGIHVYREFLRGNDDVLAGSHYAALQKGNVKVEIVTVGGDFTFDDIDFCDSSIALQTIKTVKRQISQSDHKFILIETLDDFVKVESSDAIGIVLGLEGASPIEPFRMSLNDFYEEGIRSVILTSNETNEYAGGCSDPEAGVSKKGRTLIDELNNLPIAIDLSHISETSFFQVASQTQKPLMISHANVKTLSNHFRNVSNEQINIIQQRNGVIGLSLISLFIDSKETECVSLDRFVDHVEYIKNLSGISFCGIGADFMDYVEDIFFPFFRNKGFPATIMKYPHGINSVSEVDLIFEHMKKRKFSDSDIRKVSYSNFADFFKKQLI